MSDTFTLPSPAVIKQRLDARFGRERSSLHRKLAEMGGSEVSTSTAAIFLMGIEIAFHDFIAEMLGGNQFFLNELKKQTTDYLEELIGEEEVRNELLKVWRESSQLAEPDARPQALGSP